jgi:hypothetical protein
MVFESMKMNLWAWGIGRGHLGADNLADHRSDNAWVGNSAAVLVTCEGPRDRLALAAKGAQRQDMVIRRSADPLGALALLLLSEDLVSDLLWNVGAGLYQKGAFLKHSQVS